MARKKDYECGRYDVDAVMSRIPEMLGMELTWRKDVWEGRYYINGERHPYKRDKLKVKVWAGNGKSNIYIYEQGGQALSLQSWLISYGGAADYSHAMSMIYRNERPAFDVSSFRQSTDSETRYVPASVLEEYRRYDLGNCTLFNWMCRMFGESKVRDAFERYNVTSDSDGRTIFWYVDPEGRICHDKIFKYSAYGKRDKHFVSRKFKVGDGFRSKCFFGSHLIEPGIEVNICESEKSALLAYLEWGGIWIACGGKTNLRDVTPEMRLFPDIDAISDWSAINGANIVEWWLDADVEIGETDDIGDMIVKRRMKNYYPNRYR